nr:2Fe-2S iron-sulfur cluster binding domain-containing protein [Burkholderia stabilis]
MELVVEPLNLHLNAETGSTLLDVLRSNEVPISYSCMSGRCGTCRCRVIAGHLRDNGPETGRPQAGKGAYVLACQAVLTEDCTIEIPESDEIVVHPARIVKGTVTAIDEATHDIRRLRIKLAKPLEFSPGVAGRRKGAGDGRRNGASRTGGKTRIRTVSRLRFFAVFGNCILRGIWHRFRGAVTVALEDEPVGAVA